MSEIAVRVFGGYLTNKSQAKEETAELPSHRGKEWNFLRKPRSSP